MSCIDFLWILSCHHDKAKASIFPGKHCSFLLIPRLGFLLLRGEHTETAPGPDWRGLAMKPSCWPVFMETFPVLPWRSKQDFPREARLRGINDKESRGRPARSPGLRLLIVQPTGFPGLQSKPAGNRRWEELHKTAELFHSCPHKRRAWMRKHFA